MRPFRIAAALTIIIICAAEARATDLTGDWVSPAGAPAARASVNGRRAVAGRDLYDVSLAIAGRPVLATGTFDGSTLLLVATARTKGLADLGVSGGPSDGAMLGAWTLARDGRYDVLRGPSCVLRRYVPETVQINGSRAQIAAATRALDDALGNKDGIAGNERGPADKPKGGWLSFFGRQPLLDKLASFASPGVCSSDERARLADFLASKERAWGGPVSRLPLDAVPDGALFRAEKAIALERFGRTPSEVDEGYVHASGSVDGASIAAHDVFWQRWRAKGKPSGLTIVISPGFQETGRSFQEQANLLNAQGDDVIVMDHAWAGYTKPLNPGGVDRGFSVARDVAAIAAFASRGGQRVLLLGNSMGAGPGVLGAIVLNDAGRIALDGRAMPKGLPAVLQAPFLARTGSLLNGALAAGAHVPGFKRIPLWATGLPILTHDPVAASKFSEHAAAEDLRARSESLLSPLPDIARILDLVERGEGPAGKVYVIHADHDPLADPAASVRLVSKLGARGKLDLFPGNDHVIEESPANQRRILAGVEWASR